MSKRVVVNEDGTVKKKRSCCCSCFLTVFIVGLIVLIGGTVVGCVFLNKFTEERFDMSLKETFGVVSSLYWAKDKDIVTNGYDASDSQALENEIKQQLFLKESADLDIVGAVREAVALAGSGGTETEPDDQAPLTLAVRAAADGTGENTDGTDGGNGDGTDGGKTSSEKLLDFLTGLVKKEDVDYDRLKSYTDEAYSEYCLNIDDKALAAFIDAVLEAYAGENAQLAEMLGKLGLTSLDEAAELRQITFGVENRTYITETGGYSSDTKDVAVAYLTLQLKADKILSAAAGQYINNGFLAGLASFAGRALLPNNLYVTVGLGLSDNIGVQVKVNRIDTEAKLENTYKLIRGITSLTGSEFDAKAYLDDFATNSIDPILDSIRGAADYSEMGEHKLIVDTYGTLAGLVSGTGEGEALTGPELLGTVSSLVTSEPYGAVVDEHRYDIWYEYDGVRYTLDDADRPAGAVKVDYALEFMEQLDSKYLIDVFERDDEGNFVLDGNGSKIVAEGRSFSELIDAFGMGGGATDLTTLINMNRFAQISGDNVTEEDLRITLTDKMLGAIVAENLATLGADAVASSGLDMSVVQLAVITRTADGGGTDWAEISVEIDMNSLFEGLGGVGSFLGIFLPDSVVVTVSADITLGRADEERQPAKIRYNSMTADETASMLRIMEKFGVSGFDTASLTAMIADPLNEILGNMYTALGIEIEPSRLTAEKIDPDNAGSDKYNDVSADPDNADVLLPSIYGILEKNVFTTTTDTGEVDFVSAADIKAVMDVLYAYGGAEDSAALVEALKSGSAVAADYAALQSELETKYYLRSASDMPGNEIIDFDTFLNVIDINNFSADRFDMEAFAAAGESAGYGRPLFSEAELGRLFAEKMADAAGDMDFTVLTVDSIAAAGAEPAMLKVLLEIDMSRTMGDFTNLMPADKLYVTMTVRLDDDGLVTTDNGTGYATEIAINGMGPDDARQQNLMKMLGMFSAEGLADIDGIAADIGVMLYEQIGALNGTLGGEAVHFTDGGIELPSFRDYLTAAGYPVVGA